jgi:hypothetical protein
MNVFEVQVFRRVRIGVGTLIGALSIAAVLSFPGAAVAQEATPRGAPRVIELDALTIEGRVAKPQVFYVLGRSRIEYENLRMQRVFVERILETARKNRF